MLRVDINSNEYRKMNADKYYEKVLSVTKTQLDIFHLFKHTYHLPYELNRIIIKRISKLSNQKKRNLELLAFTRTVKREFPKAILNMSALDDIGIQQKAETLSEIALLAQRGFNSRNTLTISLINSEEEGEQRGETSSSFSKNGSETGGENKPNKISLYRKLRELCALYGVTAPNIKTAVVTVDGAIKRMTDVNWWKRKLRVVVEQGIEQVHRSLGLVARQRQIYISDRGLRVRRKEKFEAEQFASSTILTNNVGQSFTLSELSAKNVSNPKIRKQELMTRMDGLEKYSKEIGYIGAFITVTCPSKHHPVYSKSGQPNEKYACYTPHESHQYLNYIWQLSRAEMHRQGIDVFGFRVVEPNHDGTPHWHLLLFVEPSNIKKLEKIMRHYALLEDGDEKGAKENRVDFKLIDPKKGRATGYIAKYISKNIDGEHLNNDMFDNCPVHAAERIEAWASRWGIRQFQQIGGAFITVWREMRRLTKEATYSEEFELIRSAADEGDYQTYLSIMVNTKQNEPERLIKPYYDISFCAESGEVKTSYYDNTLTQKLKGLLFDGSKIITRIFEWTPSRAN